MSSSISPLIHIAPSKPWSVDIFESERKHLTSFVKENILPHLNNKTKRILIKAPVKSGKREMVEYIAMRDFVINPKRIHAFLSAWHRKADEDQRKELSGQNLKVFSIINKKKAKEFISWFDKKVRENKTVILHLDECDHGTGENQTLSKIWPYVRDKNNITNILYSATPEEVLFSGEIGDPDYDTMINDFDNDSVYIEYIPPEGYCGADRFLQEGLVHEALPFFEKINDTYKISSQGKEIIEGLRQNMFNDGMPTKRNILALRLSYSELGGNKGEMKKNKAMYQFLSNIDNFPELSDFLIVVDKSENENIKNERITSEKIQWSNKKYWDRQTPTEPILLIIDQTCSRSTELKCHNRIYATHDYRNRIQFGTVSQAQERAIHYKDTYNGFQPIKIYGSLRTFKLSSGLIDHKTYLNYEWTKKKNDRRTSSTPLFRVISTVSGELHPLSREPGMKENEADYLLQTLGCYAQISLSTRISGTIRQVRTYIGEWFPSWENFCIENPSENRRNPFIVAGEYRLSNGTWLGQHRGWKHLTCINNELYQIINNEFKKIDLGSTGGTRIKVCYKDGVVGIFMSKENGTRIINTVHTQKSMYGNE
uniref:Uncharacterized protein n=1 Tax=viral metagenome TaxID=1070528 RepID=A0A6C0D3M2_9ZZZZ